MLGRAVVVWLWVVVLICVRDNSWVVGGLCPSRNLSRRLLQESMDNGGNLVYQVKAGPSRAIMKDLAIVASSPPDDATAT
jgi:hypothetical protein